MQSLDRPSRSWVQIFYYGEEMKFGDCNGLCHSGVCLAFLSLLCSEARFGNVWPTAKSHIQLFCK